MRVRVLIDHGRLEAIRPCVLRPYLSISDWEELQDAIRETFAPAVIFDKWTIILQSVSVLAMFFVVTVSTFLLGPSYGVRYAILMFGVLVIINLGSAISRRIWLDPDVHAASDQVVKNFSKLHPHVTFHVTKSKSAAPYGSCSASITTTNYVMEILVDEELGCQYQLITTQRGITATTTTSSTPMDASHRNIASDDEGNNIREKLRTLRGMRAELSDNEYQQRRQKILDEV